MCEDLDNLREHICLPAQMMDAPSLYDGKVFGSDTKGNVVALDLASWLLLRDNLSGFGF